MAGAFRWMWLTCSDYVGVPPDSSFREPCTSLDWGINYVDTDDDLQLRGTNSD